MSLPRSSISFCAQARLLLAPVAQPLASSAPAAESNILPVLASLSPAARQPLANRLPVSLKPHVHCVAERLASCCQAAAKWLPTTACAPAARQLLASLLPAARQPLISRLPGPRQLLASRAPASRLPLASHSHQLGRSFAAHQPRASRPPDARPKLARLSPALH